MQVEVQKQHTSVKSPHNGLQTAGVTQRGNARHLQSVSAQLNASPAALQLHGQNTKLQKTQEGVLQLYDIRAFDSWDEHVAWLLKGHVAIPDDLELKIGQIGDFVRADTSGVKAMYIPPGKEGLTEAGRKLSSQKANGAVVLSRAYVEEVGTLPKEERVVTLLSTIRHEFQHAANFRAGLVTSDGNDTEHNLDETLAHSENILNTQLGANSGDAPLWDQLEHLVQAEDYFSKAENDGSPLYQAAKSALGGAKLKAEAAFANEVEGTRLRPDMAMHNYLNTIDFMEPEEGRKLSVKSATMSEVLQGKFDAQLMVRQDSTAGTEAVAGGLPDQLRQGVEALSGLAMGHVKVHRNSSKPSQVNAHAFAQGSDIHLATGQEKHLPHEAWHVVQQAQGRVKPTMHTASGAPVNNDTALEREADIMGARALKLAVDAAAPRQLATSKPNASALSVPATTALQRVELDIEEFSGSVLKPKPKLDSANRDQLFNSFTEARIFNDDQYIQMLFANLRLKDPKAFIWLDSINKGLRSIPRDDFGRGKKYFHNGSYGNDLHPIETKIHRFWAGGPMKEGTLNNIKAMHERVLESRTGGNPHEAPKTPWSHIIWTSSIANQQTNMLGFKKDNPLDTQLEELRKAGVEVRDMDAIWHTLEDEFPGITERGLGWTKSAKARMDKGEYQDIKFLSDLVRLIAIYKEGGVYMDTDIGPGSLNLKDHQLFHFDKAGQIPHHGPAYREPKDLERVNNDDTLGTTPAERQLRHADLHMPVLNYFLASRSATAQIKNEIVDFLRPKTLKSGMGNFARMFAPPDTDPREIVKLLVPSEKRVTPWVSDLAWTTEVSNGEG